MSDHSLGTVPAPPHCPVGPAPSLPPTPQQYCRTRHLLLGWPLPLAIENLGPHHSSNPQADPELRPYTTYKPVVQVLRFKAHVQDFFLPGLDWQMSEPVTTRAMDSLSSPYFSAFSVTSMSQSHSHEPPATSLWLSGSKQSSRPNAPNASRSPHTWAAELHTTSRIPEAKTDNLLGTMGALRFLPLGVSCSQIPGRERGWQSCPGGWLLPHPEIARVKAAGLPWCIQTEDLLGHRSQAGPGGKQQGTIAALGKGRTWKQRLKLVWVK